MYHKPMIIVNDDSRVVNKLETSLNDAGVVIYDSHLFIVQAVKVLIFITSSLPEGGGVRRSGYKIS